MGAAMYGGRWNSIGNFVLYTAQTSSLSILEHLVHITGASSVEYTLSQIDLKNSKVINLEKDLPKEWVNDEVLSSSIGNEWIMQKKTPVLKVPSAINPLESNYLVNPNHPELEIEIVDQEWFIYDRRLVTK